MISNIISLSWNPIDCIEQNGLIIDYITELKPVGSAIFLERTTVRNFTAIRLTPSTMYSFRVAGVNSEGQGPFSNYFLVTTAGKFIQTSCYNYYTFKL